VTTPVNRHAATKPTATEVASILKNDPNAHPNTARMNNRARFFPVRTWAQFGKPFFPWFRCQSLDLRRINLIDEPRNEEQGHQTGTIAALAHRIQSTSTFRMLLAKDRISTLGAMAVRKVYPVVKLI